MVGPGAGSKNALGPVGTPLSGAPQAPGDKPNPPEGGKSLGGGKPPLRPKEIIPVTKPHPAGSVPPPARPTEMMDWRAENRNRYDCLEYI